MKVFIGIDLGSTTTKAVIIDENAQVLGRGITNSRSNYELAAGIAQDEANVSARFTLLDRELHADPEIDASPEEAARFEAQLLTSLREQQHLTQLDRLRDIGLREADADRVAHIREPLVSRLEQMFGRMEADARRPSLDAMLQQEKKGSDFFRDRAASEFSTLAEEFSDATVKFEDLMGIFDKAILQVENTPLDLTFEGNIREAVAVCTRRMSEEKRARYQAAVDRVIATDIVPEFTIGTGYGRQTLPFPKESIRSEILCHGLGAHIQFPGTRTVLDIGGQDTKAIQVDANGIVTSFQMNDRCAAGCGRYLGYIADEMSLGVHELGPLASKSCRTVKITSTCTVFAGAELRDRLAMGQKREDILAGLHRAIILRAMALLARSGGIDDEFTFTGGVANNSAAVKALRALVEENYGEKTINISPGSIYTGALGAAHFALRAVRDRVEQAA